MGEEAGSKPRKAIFSFITPSTTVRASYSVQKRSFTKALQRHRWFDEGELLDTMEKGGRPHEPLMPPCCVREEEEVKEVF
ncbi:uncharacterized protein CEXT_149901 [Caerostris extrusa]|uniref:Uncharacterized protein n=1 Tax=Caerostris extrusa TaxID=172846 RepID=A0AAV4MN20_CAEEX|nr:uncharacterized protein CEXT_149901 [Caerostris extrusa]